MTATSTMSSTALMASATLTAAPVEIHVPTRSEVPSPAARAEGTAETLRCVVCHRPFAFATGEAALVLRHTAYGYDFAHDGACLAAAREMLFLEPGYDSAAFGRDPERRRVLAIEPGAGWAAALGKAERGLAGG